MTNKPNTTKHPVKPSRKAAKASKSGVSTDTTTQEKTRTRGRPSRYRNEFAEQACKLTLLGATDADMADFFEVGEATINRWKQAHPEFRESIKRGKAVADAAVAESLYKRAVGYSHPEDDIRTVSVGGGLSQIVITPTTKHYPPETVAAIFWLKNRQPDKWRDRIEHQADVTINGPTNDELLRLFDDRMRRARERQDAVRAERGLLDADGNGEG